MQTTKVCGCCLRINQHKDLRTLYTRPGLGAPEVYAAMLADCFDIHINLDNDDECGICEECVGRLRDASDFKLQVQRSQATLRERLRGALQVKDEGPLLPHGAADGAPPEEPVSDEEPLVKAEPVYEEDGTRDETCPTEWAVKCEPWAGAARDEDSATPGCGGLFGSGALSAMPCHGATDHEASLTTHMKDMHTDSAGLRAEEEACTCDTCGEHFADKMDLVDHVQTHMETTYSCKICSLEFSCKIIFSKHLRTHKTPKVYSCEICGKVFSFKSYLNRHGTVHTGRKLYRCDICNKRFTQKGNLMAHMRIHTGLRPHQCKICNKRFTESGSLKKHMRIHTGQKPYKCEICNTQFTESSHLARHTRIHTGQKPYKCETCNKLFTRNNHLIRHIRIHTGQKPYNAATATRASSEHSPHADIPHSSCKKLTVLGL